MTPIWAADCLTICAKCGISWMFSVSNGVENPFGTPAWASSFLAFAMFFARCGTLWSVAAEVRRERAVVPHHGLPLEQRRHDARPVQGQGDRLAYQLVVERP